MPASPGTAPARLAERLGVDYVGPDLAGDAWLEHAAHEAALADERELLRTDLLRVRASTSRAIT